MEDDILKVNVWYNEQLKRLKHTVMMNIRSIHRASRLSWKNKRLMNTRIIKWYQSRKLQLGHIKDTRISNIRNTYTVSVIPTITKKALLVGINYEGTSSELKGCVNDVYDLRNMLVSKYEYKQDNIQLLINTKATRKNILDAFIALLQSANEGDHICFTFSGHGYYTADMYEKDEMDGYDEMIVTADNQTIVDDTFKQLIQTHLKEKVTLFSLFDNCHSGTIYDLRYQYLDSSIQTNESMSVHSNPNVLDTSGQVILLSGCMDGQVSLDARINGKFNGVMTWCFLEALRQSNYEDTWETLLERIRTILNVNKLQQIPQMSSGIPLDTKQKLII
uniref:Peptidase C14 caspase domain-containing protein n=1 Tax=viral metagenome TaxID=1070528 RepID=A0A6C0JUG6_9ZZZZ